MLNTGNDQLFAQLQGATRYRDYLRDAELYRATKAAIGPSRLGRVLGRVVRGTLDKVGTLMIAVGRRLCRRGGVEVKVSFHAVNRSDTHAA